MKIFPVILFLFSTTLFIYGSRAIFGWICEWRISALQKKMRREIKALENLQISGALLYTKNYKIKEDYRHKILNIEEVQKLVVKRMKIIKISPLKNNSLKPGPSAGMLFGSRALE